MKDQLEYKPAKHPSPSEQLESVSVERARNAVEQILENPDASGMEEENMLLLDDLGTLDRNQQEQVINNLAEHPNTEIKRESITGDTVTKVVYKNREGVAGENAWIEFDMGASELEKVTAPRTDINESLNDLRFLDQKVYEAIDEAARENPELAGAGLYQIGQAPSMMDDKLAAEIDDIYNRAKVKEGFTPEELEKGSVEKIRYSQHGQFWTDEEGKSVLAGVLGTASLQLSTHGQIEPYFEDISQEDMEAFVKDDETPETVLEAFDEYIKDFHGGGEMPGMTRIAPILFYDERLSPEFEENEMIRVAARNDHYDKMNEGKGVEKQKHFDFPGFDRVESNHDLTNFNSDFVMEFGPEAEAQNLYSTETGMPIHMKYEELEPTDEVSTVFSNEDGEKKALRELLEDREAVGTAVFEYGGEEVSENVVFDIDELMSLQRSDEEMTDDEKKFVQGLYAMETSGIWPHFRMRDDSGASFESRLPPATPRRKDSAYQQQAVLKGSLDIQKQFSEVYGVNEITHDQWQQIETGIDQEQGDYELPFKVEGKDGFQYDDVTVEELKYGSERIEPLMNVLEDTLADSVGAMAASSWRQRKESQNPVYEEFEQNYKNLGIKGAVLETKLNPQNKDTYMELEELLDEN